MCRWTLVAEVLIVSNVHPDAVASVCFGANLASSARAAPTAALAAGVTV
jgi:hypothetical protein